MADREADGDGLPRRVPGAPPPLVRGSTGPQRDAHNAWKILLQVATARHPSIDGVRSGTVARSARRGPGELRHDDAAAPGAWLWLDIAAAARRAVRQVAIPGTT